MTGRDRLIVAIACLAALLVAPWLLVVSPKRSQASKLQSQINSVQSQLVSVRAQAANANAARTAFATSYTTLVRLGEAVPTDDNTPSLIYQLQAAAKVSKVDFQSLTFNAGQGGSAPTAPTPSTSKTSTTSSTLAAATALPPGATIGAAGFPVEPFTFTFQGSFFHLAEFLGRLQKFVVANNQNVWVSGRLMSLNAITLGQSSGSPQITATISATTYLLPASQGLLNGATPAGPATSTTQTVSNSSPTSSTPPAVVTAP
jgi:Type II secretion system (T2SS), protein M